MLRSAYFAGGYSSVRRRGILSSVEQDGNLPLHQLIYNYGTRASAGKQVGDLWGERGIEYRTSLKKQPKHRAMLQTIPGIVIDCVRVLFVALVRGTFAVHFFFFFGEIMTYAMVLVREDRGSRLRP